MIKTLLFNLFSTSKKSFALNVKLMCLGMFFVVSFANAAVRTASVSGLWSSTATWGGLSVPGAGDTVIINSGVIVTLNVNTPKLLSVTINSAGANNGITFNPGFLLDITGGLIMNASSTGTSNSTVAVGTGTLNAGSISIPGGTTTNRFCMVSASTGIINVSGNVTFTGTAAQARLTLSGAAILNISGDFSSGGTFAAGTGTVNFIGDNQSIGSYATYFNLTTSGSGDKTLAGPITVRNLLIGTGTWLIDNDKQIAGNAAGTLTLQVGGGLQLGGGDTSLSVDPTSFPSGYLTGNIDLKGQVKYNYNGKKGGVQTISTVPTYNDLECQFPGTKRAGSGTLTIKGGFATASHLDLSTNNPTINLSGNFTLYNVGANVLLTSNPFSIGGDFVNDLLASGSLSNGGGTVIFNGIGAQAIKGSSTVITAFNNLTVNKTSGILSLTSSNQTIGSNLTITAGTLDLSTFTLNRTASGGTLNIANGATLRIGGTNNYPVNFGTYTLGATSIVEYYASANQTVGAVKYGNLVLSGSAIKTFPTSIVTIAGNLNINSGVVADLSNAMVTHTAATLTLGGMSTPAGTWGSTTSNATNINDTYFTAMVGKVNVGASCLLPAVYAMTGVTNKTYCSIEAGSTMGLSSSENGVSYQLKKGNVVVATVANGNGSPISFGVYNSTGNYTVVATRVGTFCTATMNGAINIYRTSSPPLPTATVANASCPGTATGSITVTNTVAPSSLSFVSANTQYVDLNTTLLSNRTAFTVEGWIKFDATKVVPRMSLFGQNDVIEIAFEDGGLKCWTPAGSVLVPMAEITGGYVWHHIAVTGDGSTLKIYIDGGTPKSANVPTSNYGISNDTTKMGYGVMDSGGVGLTGEVFKLGFWNRALTAGEILTLSSGFVEYDASLSGLLAGYSFNESAGTTISSVGSVAPIGILKNNPTWTDPYTYTWTSNPAGFTSNSKNITGLTDRTYNLITSLKGCTNLGSWTVNADNLSTALTGQPSNTIVCAGSNASFGVTATGTTLTYKWQVSTNGGTNFSDLTNSAPYSGVTTETLNITGAATALNNNQYRCVVTGTCLPAVTSSAATLTVNSLPSITGQPSNTIVCAGSNASFGVTATGTTLTYKWQVSTNGGTNFNDVANSAPYSNVTTATLNITATTVAMSTYQYRCIVSGTCTPSVTSSAVTLTVNSLPSITSQPTNSGICVGSNTSFGVTATGTTLTYKWQVSTNGGTNFSDLANNAPYSGVITSTLNITGATIAMNNYQYRSIVSGICTPAVTSSVAILTVNPNSVGGSITSTATANSLCTATNNVTLTLSGQTGTVLRWESSTDNLFTTPTPISNTTTSLLISNIASTTYYRTVVKSGACNTATSSFIKIITGKPTANAATAENCAGFTANWNKVDGADTYLISISKDNFVTILSAYNGKDVGGDVNSFSVTGLAPNTNYQYQIHAVLPCGTYAVGSNIISVTTSDLPISGTFTGGAAEICIGEKTTFTNGTLGGTWSISNGTGSASITTGGVVTGEAQGLVTVVYAVTNGTCSNSTSQSLTINPPVTTPTVDTVTPISCTTATGSIALSSLPAGSWTIKQSGFAAATINGNGNIRTISGLAKGSYTFTVTEGNCTSGETASIEIKDESETIWNGTIWSNGNPTKDKKVTILSVSPNQPFIGDLDPLVYKDIFACSLTIDSGSGEVVIPSNITLTITNAVITSGNLRFKNNSSLIQKNNNSGINSGNIFYERTTTPIFQKDYVYWSTPVNPQKVGDVSPFSSKFYGNDGVQWVTATKPTLMKVGHGYIIRGPDNYNNDIRQDYPAVFMGVPNNGNLESEELIAKRSYLIGNPYPSALSAEALINENKMLDGTLYFWTHNTPQDLTTYTQYSPDDYAVFNLSGSVSASAKSDPLHNDDPSKDKGKKPSGKIAAGQGFYVRVILQGKVKYNNSMRLGASDNTQFFKPGAAGAIEKNRIWLNMTNAGGAFKQLLVSYIEGATNNYESKYDGVTFNANPYLDFYSVNNNTKYVIQGRALPFVDTDIVPLGYKTTIKGDFTISIDEVDGKMSNQAIYLEDKTTGEIHDLRASNYTFKTEIGTFLDRLVLRYTGKSLGTGDFENLENGILVSVKNKVINVLSSKENIKEVAVFDISGKLLYSKKKVGNTELQIPNLQSGDQVLLIKVTLENDFTTTKKVIFN
ncbi:T9SS sorting signal type C domain-containing protein [Flavobacterium sp. FlaQc-57]|uniref:T9SS sorting signal type C domain-containing protein n=1 Tax=Flavobacterium sp. FlaQc-57 TaxID=3374186 RepID=UPI0037579BE5